MSLTDWLWYAVRIIAIAVLASIGILGCILPILRERRRRRRCARRERIQLNVWLDQFYPDQREWHNVISVMLESLARLYGVDASQLRPSDVFREEYGMLARVVTDDAYAVLTEVVHVSLREAFGVAWSPPKDVSLDTLDDVVGAVLAGEFLCPVCGHDLRGDATNVCRECGCRTKAAFLANQGRIPGCEFGDS